MPSAPDFPLHKIGATREAVEAFLMRHNGKISEAARTAGVTRMTVYRWVRRFGLDPLEVRKKAKDFRTIPARFLR